MPYSVHELHIFCTVGRWFSCHCEYIPCYLTKTCGDGVHLQPYTLIKHDSLTSAILVTLGYWAYVLIISTSPSSISDYNKTGHQCSGEWNVSETGEREGVREA